MTETVTKPRIVMGLSGGMDSVTMACHYLDKGYDVFPVIFNYGSKHNEYENKAAVAICELLNMDYKFVELPYINDLFTSNLLKSGGDIPEGHYEEESMEKTVVPGRNLIFISNLMGYAWSINAATLAVGVHAGDHAIYADCREEFIMAADMAVYLGSDRRVRVEAPFQRLDKEGILRLGFSLRNIIVPYELTRTCYKDQEHSCGKCGSCTERLEAFRNIGIADPITYE